MNYRWPGNVNDSQPSVYSYIMKPGSTLPQINFFGITRDVKAVSRAQVFYWDPNRNRSQQLRGFNPPREPNFFNPFWRARLARLDNDWWARAIAFAASGDPNTLFLLNH